jgi:erythrin-vacuolar iron transport family protein
MLGLQIPWTGHCERTGCACVKASPVFTVLGMRSFNRLSEREILALAITSEEEDARIYGDLADGVRAKYPATAEALEQMRKEEVGHRTRLFELYRQRFGEHIPLIRREDVRGFPKRRPVWLTRPLGLGTVRKQAADMEAQTRQFYERGAQRTTDAGVRQLLNELADEERKHSAVAENIREANTVDGVYATEDDEKRRLFVLQIVQPGLAGLMDGSVSTLAPLFAAAFATHNSSDAFRVGLAASIGAGISMGFAEALSDDGSLTGRGHPWMRGIVCGLMTTLGGIFHTPPYTIHNFNAATSAAAIIVAIELLVISWIRKRYMDTPFLTAAFQVVVGGVLVFLAGILIGSS